jgi:hypothetical protein
LEDLPFVPDHTSAYSILQQQGVFAEEVLFDVEVRVDDELHQQERHLQLSVPVLIVRPSLPSPCSDTYRANAGPKIEPFPKMVDLIGCFLFLIRSYKK